MSAVVVTAYLSSAGAYLVLALLLACSWRRQRIGGLLIAAATVSLLWSAFLAYTAWRGAIATSWLFLADAVRYGAWFGFLVALLSLGDRAVWLRWGGRVAHAAWIAIALYCLSSGAGLLRLVSVPFFLGAPVIGMLVLALGGLMLLEQLYRNADPARRWSLKFLVLGLGALFAFDILMYSDAALYGFISANLWIARGFVNALVVPLIVVAAARNRKWAVPVGISRKAVFYTSTLFVVALYIVAAAAGGYFVRIYGGDWGRVAAITFAFFAGLLLLILVSSGQARARFRLFLYKNFFSLRHDYREQWLRLTAALAGGGPDLPLRAIQGLAGTMESPGGALFLRRGSEGFEARQQWNMPAASGMTFKTDPAFVEFVRQRQWIYDFTEPPPLQDSSFAAPAELVAIPHVWLLVPLLVGEELIGFVALAQGRARRRLDWEDIDLLRTAGRPVASLLAQAENARRLAEAQQFEGFNRLTTFMMHDLKNLVAQQSLMLKNAERHRHNQDFVDDMIATTANAVERTNRILEQLRSGSASGARNRVRLRSTVEKAVQSSCAYEPQPTVKVDATDVFVQADAERLASVLGHIIRNAQEATSGDAREVVVQAQRDGDRVCVEIRDNGCGMDQDFMQTRLFKPFFTTKGSKGMGIGAYQAKEYIDSLGGRMTVMSAPGRGTTVRLILPIDDPDDNQAAVVTQRRA